MPSPLQRFLLCLAVLGLGLAGCERAGDAWRSAKAAFERDAAERASVASFDPADIPPPPEPVATPPVVNKDARVSVLGYHDFTEGPSTNDMILNIGDFRDQMQALRTAGLPVISMREFLDWKRGEAAIPDQSVLITIDDGWLATHTLAMEVLREFDYPYTVFLYKNYIGIGGRSLSHEQIRELIANGATIGSHSVSHQNLARQGNRSEAAYEAWLREELEESYRYLEEHFGDTGGVVKTFAYPFGNYNERVVELATEFGYEACFTVNGTKTSWNDDPMKIGRYVVHGTTLANFDAALSFGSSGSGVVATSGRRLISETVDEDGAAVPPLVAVRPPPGSIVGNRLPLLEVDLSRLEGVDPASLAMRVSGFTKVPHRYDPATGIVSYQIPQRLRLDHCSVQLSVRHAASGGSAETIAWEFRIDRLADYLSAEATEPGRNDPLETPGGGDDADENAESEFTASAP